MEPKNKTVRVAARLDAINDARRQGLTWGEIAEQGSWAWGNMSPASLQTTIGRARRAVAKGLYAPPPRPLIDPRLGDATPPPDGRLN